jgi:O-antigen/teichoic acid export membrane protein
MISVADRVIFPLLSKYKDMERHDLRATIRRQRYVMLLPLALLVGVLGAFGDLLILFLYDDRYAQAAWIFPILALGMWPLMLYGTIDKSLYVIGKPNWVAMGNLAKFIYMVVAVPIAYRLGGSLFAVLAVAFNDLPMYVIDTIGLKRERLALIGQDALVTTALAVVVVLFLGVRAITGMAMPWNTVAIP